MEARDAVKEIVIERKNQRAIKFRGRIVGSGTNRVRSNGKDRKKWLAVDIYEAERDDDGAVALFYVAVVTVGGMYIEPYKKTEMASTPAALLRKLAKPDRRNHNELFVHESFERAFEEAALSVPEFGDALIRDLT